MKPILFVVVGAVALLAGFVGAAVAVSVGVTRAAVASAEDAVQVASAQRAENTALAHTPQVGAPTVSMQGEIDRLHGRVDELEIELAGLREERARQATPLALAPLASDDQAALGGVQRDAVVQILAEEKKKEDQKREDERKARELEAINRMAERAAKDLGLNAADQKRLADFMGVAAVKRDEFFKNARDTASGPESWRTAMDDYRAWRDTELTSTFGGALGQQLIEYQRDQRDGFGGGFGGGGGTPGGGQGGQQSGQGSFQGARPSRGRGQ